jgi:hypothetical protein
MKKDITKDLNIDLQYKLGFVQGYGDRYPNLVGLSPIMLPIIGLNYKLAGFDITIIPDDKPIFCGNFRINLPKPEIPQI